MASTRLGYIELDDQLLADDLSAISKATFTSAYAEFAFGSWRTLMVRNYEGKDDDAVIRMHNRSAVETPAGRRLPYLRRLISDHFDTERMRYARIMKIEKNAGIIPHRDYLEFSDDYVRLHLPIQTDERCMNSEGGKVYHLERGEIWFLDASQIHSAVSLSDQPRLPLVMDFASDVPPPALIRNYRPPIDAPATLVRPPIPQSALDAIRSLSQIVNESTLTETISILCKLHFRYETEPTCVFDWLHQIADLVGDKHLQEKVCSLAQECIQSRSSGRLSDAAVPDSSIFRGSASVTRIVPMH
jgi:L-proline cis-4-hydroxylase